MIIFYDFPLQLLFLVIFVQDAFSQEVLGSVVTSLADCNYPGSYFTYNEKWNINKDKDPAKQTNKERRTW